MKIIIKTIVEQNYKTVFEGFNEALFLALKPPFLPLTLRQFDGSMTGDKVKITLGKGFLSQKWDALIVEQKETDTEIYFIDEGTALPFFLKKWRHQHRILKLNNDKSVIIDNIYFKTPLGKLSDILIYPIIFFQFWLRKPIYKRYFSQKRQ